MNVEVGDLTDPQLMNPWIIDAIERAMTMKTGTCYRSHYTSTQVCIFSIQMMAIEQEFTELMKRYQLPVVLEHENKTDWYQAWCR